MTRLLRRSCLVLALLAGVASAQTSTPQERDLWFAHVDGDLRYGSHRLQVTALPDGNYRYQLSTRVLFDLFGSQRQEINVRAEYVVARDLRPVSMQVETEQMSGTSVVTGRMEESSFILSSDRGRTDEDTVIAIDPSQTVLFSVSVDDWLAQLDPATERATAQVIDEDAFVLETMFATRVRSDASGSEWRVDSGEDSGIDSGEATLTLDTRGVLLEVRARTPHKHVVRCSEEEARELAYRNLNGREVLTFPLDRDISAPHRLEELVVRLTWKDVPFEEFQLEDARQRIVERAETSEGHMVRLSILPPPALVEGVTIPVEDPAFAPFLAETDYIKPTDSKIVAAARAAIAGTADAAEAVAALSHWVFGHVEGEMIADTLSGPEVLARGKGKCTEYSTLFASMARAVGIPTRVVLGERMVAGSWMGHMWNEAWVGRWVTVDASADEVDRSLVLLKFIHSDTVMGTQPLRWAVTESLSISIEEFRVAESPLAGTYETGVDGVTYTHVDYVAQLSAPADDWTLVESSEGGTPVVGFVPPDADDVAFHFVAFALPEGTEPSVIIDARLERNKSTFETHEVLANEAREVRGAKGQASRFLGRKSDRAICVTEVCWTRGSFGYLLTMNSKAPVHEVWLADFDKLIASFRFLDE